MRRFRLFLALRFPEAHSMQKLAMAHDSLLRARYPKSFQRLLLTGFLLIALLPGAALVKTLFVLDELARESHLATYQAAQLTQALQVLDQQTVAMERSARQYLLLEDSSLLQGFEAEYDAAQQTLLRILQLDPTPALLGQVQAWQAHARPIASIMLRQSLPAGADQGVLLEHFTALAELDRQLLERSGQMIDQRLQDMQRDVARQKREMVLLVAGVLLLAVLLALGFGYLISRPVRQLDQAIRQLGDNNLEQTIGIEGPADLAHLGERLDWLRQRLRELEAEKSRFLHHMSHELKTPLAAMREGAELLSDEVAGALAPGQRQIARILRQNSLIMQKQIEDLLNYNAARFATSQLQEENVAVHNILVATLQACQLQMRARQIEVDLQIEPVEARCDAEKLRTIFDNLISNAVKFTPAGSRIQLRLAVEGDSICFDCIDHGPGIAEADRPRIFEAFFQGSQQPHCHVQGSGIGLSIAREYAGLHGGSITLIRGDGGEQGTHFQLRLPRRPSLSISHTQGRIGIGPATAS